ncbi:MAG: carbon-nitrogen hydrolase family protein [Planctomycetes bacterium]|nr:carbon-nitrogen hydrolase family protein [Planctomycetota bacterium]
MKAKLAVGQPACRVGQVAVNLRRGVEMIREAGARGASLLCLPECFTTGLVFGEMERLAERVPGPTTDRLGEAARAARAHVLFGMVEANPAGKPFNAAVLLDPDGRVSSVYRKVHLYMAEAEVFAAGARRSVVDLGFCTAGITICYDYIFPEYIRRLVDRGARLLLHPTAWVNTDECERWRYNTDAYRAVGIARAVENTIFYASSNHASVYDSAGSLRGIGHSSIVAPWGEILAEVPEGEGMAVAECDFASIEGWQKTAAPYLRDRRGTLYEQLSLC